MHIATVREALRMQLLTGLVVRARRIRPGALLLCALISLAVPQANACSAGDVRCERLDQLLKFLRYEESIARLKKTCVDARATFHPDRWVKTEPEAFFGLSPASNEWPLVVQTFERYVQESCTEPSEAVLLEKYRQAWDERLSDAQLEAIVSFFSTEAGAVLSGGIPQVYREFLEFYEPLASRRSYEAWVNYGQRVAAIARGR